MARPREPTPTTVAYQPRIAKGKWADFTHDFSSAGSVDSCHAVLPCRVNSCQKLHAQVICRLGSPEKESWRSQRLVAGRSWAWTAIIVRCCFAVVSCLSTVVLMLCSLAHVLFSWTLAGPPGCGKTITVKTLACELGIEITDWTTPTPVLWAEHLQQVIF